MVTSNIVILANRTHHWFFCPASVVRSRAPRVEAAARGRIDRGGKIAHEFMSHRRDLWVRNGDRVQ